MYLAKKPTDMPITKFTKESSIQRIKSSFLDDTIELTPKQETLKKQIRFAFSLRLSGGYSQAQTVKMIREEFGCSEATAYRICSKAMYVLGAIDTTDAKAEKIILRDTYFKMYKTLLGEKKYDSALKSLERYEKLFDFSEKSEIEDTQLKAHQYNIVVNRSTKQIINNQLGTGLIDLNSYPNPKDIQFKEENDAAREENS